MNIKQAARFAISNARANPTLAVVALIGDLTIGAVAGAIAWFVLGSGC